MGELGATMTSAEFSLWLKLYESEPWDDTRMDVGFAVVASTVANYAGKILKEGKEATLAEFMPFVPRNDVLIEPDPVEFFGKFA